MKIISFCKIVTVLLTGTSYFIKLTIHVKTNDIANFDLRSQKANIYAKHFSDVLCQDKA